MHNSNKCYNTISILTFLDMLNQKSVWYVTKLPSSVKLYLVSDWRDAIAVKSKNESFMMQRARRSRIDTAFFSSGEYARRSFHISRLFTSMFESEPRLLRLAMLQ